MKKLFKRITTGAFILTGAVVIPLAVIASNSPSQDEAIVENSVNNVLAASSSEASAFENANLASSIDNGNIFHAWNWSMTTIEANLDKIKAAGFTTIQTSPMQPQKDYYSGDTAKGAWWKLYQPLGFSIATKNNALGTKQELIHMVSKAHEKGLNVIVDVVANHLAGSSTQLSIGVKEYEPEIYGSNGNLSGGAKLHSETIYKAEDYSHTTNGNIDLPDLNTHDSHVQQRVLSLCKEYIDCGVDGFRFDAAKHIETENSAEPWGASNFWPTVINGTTSYAKSKGKSTPYYYGEILYTVGSNRSYSWYTKYMDVIDNKVGNSLTSNFSQHTAAATSYYETTGFNSGEKVVVWAESHDTYANDNHESTNYSIYDINKSYAIMGARNGAEALYLARPTDTAGTDAWVNCSVKLGQKGSEAYSWKQIEGVNKFRNYWGTSNEYLFNSNGFAQVVRYNGSESGMVLVNANSSTDVNNVSVPDVMKSGTYKDYVTGNSFTVSNGKVSGKIDGNSGIAVLYKEDNHVVTEKDTVYFVNSKNWSNVYVYAWKGKGGTGNQNAIWPGIKMTKTGEKLNGYDIYSYTSSNFLGEYENIIFTDNNGSKTNDLNITLNQYDANGNASTYSGGNNIDEFDKNTVYFVNSKNWSNVYVYAWKGKGGTGNQNAIWPGIKMTKTGTKVNGYDVYSYTTSNFLGEYEKIIFTDNNGSKTNDLTITLNQYDASGNSSIYEGGGNVIEENNKIYFINTKNWSKVYVYAWKGNGGTGNQNSNWPGVKMTKTGAKVNGYDVYVLEETDFLIKWENVIFTNNNGSQTKDIKITTNCYNASGTATTYEA